MALDTSGEADKLGPDYFGLYVSEVSGLLSGENDLHSSPPEDSNGEITNGAVGGQTIHMDIHDSKGHLFCDIIGASLPELKKERLKSLLVQSLVSLSQEVDEVVDPVLSMCQLQNSLKYRKSSASATTTVSGHDYDQPPQKKIRLSILSTDPESEKMDVTIDASPRTSSCPAIESSKSMCDTPGSRRYQQFESPRFDCDTGADNETGEANDDMQILLESDNSQVEEAMKKYADELLATIEHMECMLDRLLHSVISTCRPMSRPEKRELKKLIQNLPARNLDGIVGVIKRCRQEEETRGDEIHVDLEKEDGMTLWRLYFYVQTVESVRKLCQTQFVAER